MAETGRSLLPSLLSCRSFLKQVVKSLFERYPLCTHKKRVFLSLKTKECQEEF